MNNIDLNVPTTNDHNYVFKENAGRNVSIENAGRNDNGRDDYLLKIDASEENAGWDAANADRIAYGWERLTTSCFLYHFRLFTHLNNEIFF